MISCSARSYRRQCHRHPHPRRAGLDTAARISRDTARSAELPPYSTVLFAKGVYIDGHDWLPPAIELMKCFGQLHRPATDIAGPRVKQNSRACKPASSSGGGHHVGITLDIDRIQVETALTDAAPGALLSAPGMGSSPAG